MAIRKCIALWFALLGLVIGAPAAAGDISVVVRDDNGRPVPNAVVIIDAPGRAPAPRHYVINQQNMQFVPGVLVIPSGSTVEFGNLDPFRHHVYSFSPENRFELRLFGEGETRPVTFSSVGLVSIGCNIHDQMEAFIQVVDTPHAGKTDANGRLTIRNVPSGNHQMRIWHSRLRAPGNTLTMQVSGNADRTIQQEVRLRRPPPRRSDY